MGLDANLMVVSWLVRAVGIRPFANTARLFQRSQLTNELARVILGISWTLANAQAARTHCQTATTV